MLVILGVILAYTGISRLISTP